MNKYGLIFILALVISGCGGSDGGGSSVSKTPVEQALETGDASLVEEPNELIEASARLVEEYKADYSEIKRQLSLANDGTALSNLHWDPTHDTAIISPTYGFNDAILKTNKAMVSGYEDQELVIGVAGYQSNGSRYAALASNPFRTQQRFPSSVNSEMETWLLNLVTWVSGSSNKPQSIVLAQMDQSHYFPDDEATRNWLTANNLGQTSINVDDQCDGQKLSQCIADKPDLLIISQKLNSGDEVDAVLEGVRLAFEQNIPVLYLHLDGGMTELGHGLFSLMNITYVGDNYWRKLGLTNWDSTQLIDQVPESVALQQELLKKLHDESFTVNLQECEDKSCSDTSLMAEQFYPAAQSIQQHLTVLDKSKTDLFATSDYQYEKLLILLADRYRQDVSFPMDKESTRTIDFLKSYYSDYTQYHSRKLNAAQPDLGNFSTKSFEDIERFNKTVQMESKRNFRSAGVYVIPGQTFKVTRIDQNSVTTSIVINSLRSGATHEFSTDGYSRPKILTSTSYRVEPGETISLTSAYGGTVQVHFDTNDVDVELRFENIAQHPIWRSENDNESFIAQLAEAKFDWAELMTPGFEVHSKLEKMQESVSPANWAKPEDMAAATEKYVHDLPHALAGFEGPGITNIQEIHQYGKDQGWEIQTIDIVKHMNADQANCGYGCSGNPYDAYWSFNPLGHGDLHELGHGLEKSRFRFTGWEGHATTNYYSYYSKSRYYADEAAISACQSLDFKGQFELLQQSRLEADPNAFMAAQNQTSWSWGARVYIQMMMSAQHQNVLENGWHLLGRLHLIEREFTRLKSSDELWNAQKGTIGFANYTREEANSLNNDDWQLIALSYVAEHDMRAYLDMWGFSFSDKAKEQVASLNLNEMPLNYFASSEKGYCLDEFAVKPVSVNGTNIWPLN